MDGSSLALLDESSLMTIFATLDSQDLGYLVQSDLAIMCEQMQVDPGQVEFLMQLLDRDGDGKITFDDFRAGFGQATKEQLVALSPSPRRRGGAQTAEPVRNVASPLARTASDSSQGKPADMEAGSDQERAKSRHRHLPSVTVTDPAEHDDSGQAAPEDQPANAYSTTLFEPEAGPTADYKQAHDKLRLISGLEPDGASVGGTPVGRERPAPDGALDDAEEDRAPPRDAKHDGVEVEPKFTLNLKRFGRRSRPLSDAFPHQEEDDDDLFGMDATPPETPHSPSGTPVRGARQHFLDSYRQSSDEQREHGGGGGVLPRTPTASSGARDSLRYTALSNKIGLHSIAEALSEHSPESRSPMMASTPTTGRKSLLRTLSPLTRLASGQELFETAGPLSPVTELSQEDASAFLEEQVRSVLEECNISPGRAIDKKDFSLVCRQLNMDIPDKEVDELFDQLDKTGEGLISLDGFVEGVSNSFTNHDSPLGNGSISSSDGQWGQNRRSPGMGGDVPFTPFSGKTSTNRRSVTAQRPGTPMQRSSSTNRVGTPVVPFSHKRELFPVMTQLLEPDESGMVKIDTIYKVWQEEKLDMENDDSNAIKFLLSLEMNTNGTVDINHLTTRLESALENDDSNPNSTGDRYLALHIVHNEVHALRVQSHQAGLETQKACNDLSRLQEEHNRLVTEGDDLVELQTKRHELRLREAEGKFSEKMAAQEREMRSIQDKLSGEESMQRQRLEQELQELQSEEKNLRAELKERQELLEQYEGDVAEANSQVHLWKSQCSRIKEDLDAQRIEALHLLQRESDDKAFQEQLELEIAKRMETERASLKALQDQFDEMKADRDGLRNQLTIALKKSGKEKRSSTKRLRADSTSRVKQDGRVKASPHTKRRSSSRLHVASAGGLATPNTNRRSLTLDLSDPSDQETSTDTNLLSPLDMSLMDELNSDSKSPLDDSQLQMSARCESLEKEKLELVDSNRLAEEKCCKLADDVQAALVAQEKAVRDASLLQTAMKAVDMQKTQLVVVKEQLSSQLEETQAQLVTSRQQCRDTEDRVVALSSVHSALCEQLETTQHECSAHQEASARIRDEAAALEAKLTTALASLQETQVTLEAATRAKGTLEVQVLEIGTKLDNAVARRAELEETIQMSDTSLRAELAELRRSSGEECAALTDTVERLQERLDEETTAVQAVRSALQESTSQREDLGVANAALQQNVELLIAENASATKQLEGAQDNLQALAADKSDLERKVEESYASLGQATDQLHALADEKTTLVEERRQLLEDIEQARLEERQQLLEDIEQARLEERGNGETRLQREVEQARREEHDEAERRTQEALARSQRTWDEAFAELNDKCDASAERELNAERRAAAMATRVTQLEAEHLQLQAESAGASDRLRRAEDGRVAEHAELEAARSQIAAHESRVAQLTADVRSRAHDDDGQAAEWEQRRAELEAELREAQDSRGKLESDLVATRTDVDDLQQSLASEKLKLAEAEAEVGRIGESMATADRVRVLEVQDLNEKLQTKDTSVGELEARVKSLADGLEDAQSASADAQAVNATLEATVEQLRASHDAATERLSGSLAEQCQAVRRETREECERQATERIEEQTSLHVAELARTAEAHTTEVEQLNIEMATLQAQLVSQGTQLRQQSRRKDTDAIIVDLRTQVNDLETQVASERGHKMVLHEQLRGAIADNTRLTLDMTRLQRDVQEQADGRMELQQQQRKGELDRLERRNHVLDASVDKQQREILHLREELRGSEHLRQLSNRSEERWADEKNELLKIVQQLTDLITAEPVVAAAPSPAAATATGGRTRTPPHVASRTKRPTQNTTPMLTTRPLSAQTSPQSIFYQSPQS